MSEHAVIHPMRLSWHQKIEDQSVVYEVKVTRALMEDMRDLRTFEGWFCVNSMVLRQKDNSAGDFIGLQPEGLAMQLLRLAYIAARHEEGPYGEPEEFSQDTD